MKILSPLVALILFAACSMRGQPEPGASGAEIFAVSGCIACHGDDRSGTGSGPSLRNLGQHWSVPNLGAYLAAPGAVIAQDPRLQKLDAKFGASMPGFDNLNQFERERLAHWLLTPN